LEYPSYLAIFVRCFSASQKCNVLTNKTSVKILDMTHVETPNEFTKEHWRGRFNRAFLQHPNFSRKELSEIDSYFLSAIGKDDINHVKKGRAGVEKTARVTIALETIVTKRNTRQKSTDKIIKRSKIEV
jgi:hypothetical protein